MKGPSEYTYEDKKKTILHTYFRPDGGVLSSSNESSRQHDSTSAFPASTTTMVDIPHEILTASLLSEKFPTWNYCCKPFTTRTDSPVLITSRSRPFKADLFPSLVRSTVVAHVAGWGPYNLYDVARVSWGRICRVRQILRNFSQRKVRNWMICCK